MNGREFLSITLNIASVIPIPVIHVSFYINSNYKLTEKSLPLTELNKFGAIGSLQFSKEILLSHVAELLFRNFQYV